MKLSEIRKMNLHHIDFNKKNDKRSNLVFLCNSCHAKTNWHREYYLKFLREFNEHIELKKNGDINLDKKSNLEKTKILEELNNG